MYDLETDFISEKPILDNSLFEVWKIYNNLPGNFFWKDKNGRYLWINKNALELLQFGDEKTITGKTDHELWPNQAEILIENDKKILESGRVFYFEEIFQHQGETKCLIMMKSPLVNNLGEVCGIIGSFIQSDKINRIRTNYKSCVEINSAQYINSIIEAVPGSIYWKNKEGVWIGCNEFTIQTTGVKDIIGKTDYQLWPDQADVLRKNDFKVMNTGCVLKDEETVILPNGEQRIFAVVKKPLLDEHNEIVGVVGNSIDITELKKTQTKLLEAKKKAEVANDAKTAFIANMSHDIRTPLSGVVGMSQLLIDTLQNKEQKQYAEWLNESGEQLLILLNAILEIISADNLNELDLQVELFELRNCIESIVQLERPTMHLKRLDLRIDLDPAIPKYIKTDRTKLHRIILPGYAVYSTNAISYAFVSTSYQHPLAI